MKQLRSLAGLGVLMLLAACSAGGDDGASANAAIVARDGTTALPGAAADAVKAETGHDVTGARALPIYEPQGVSPAFYEVDLAPGWAVVSAGVPGHVVEYGTSGRSPSARLDASARSAMKRMYRLDPAIYVAADASGHAVGRSTKSLVRIDRSGPEAAFVPVTSDEALQGFRVAQVEMQQAEARGPITTRDAPIIGDAPPATTCTVPGDVPSYVQLNPNQAPNTTACDSGCGPTAWATVFGWASRRAVDNAAGDATFASLFTPNGSAVEAPLTMNDDIANLSMQINGVVQTSCLQGEGMTTPWAMANVKSMVGPGLTVDVHYNILMMADNGIRDQVIAALCDGRPSIIGIGSMFGGDGHYPIAKGYDNGKFELEMGWGGDGNGFYDATTWFVGSIHH